MPIKPIEPRLYDPGAIKSKILRSKEEGGRQARRKLERTTATWSGARPTFVASVDGRGTLRVGPKPGGRGYEKWVMLDRGTRRHPITARRAPRLAFRHPGFIPKTTPRYLGAGPGRRATGPIRRPFSVMHPGTKGRFWSETITEESAGPLTRLETKALREGLAIKR